MFMLVFIFPKHALFLLLFVYELYSDVYICIYIYIFKHVIYALIDYFILML